MTRRTTSRRLQKLEPKQWLALFTQTAAIVERARLEAGPVAPAKGPRGLRRRQRKLRHRANEARRLQITSRRATVALLKHGVYIEPRMPTRDRVADLLRRI